MIAKEDLQELLQNRLKNVLPADQIEELTKEVEALEEGWEEVHVAHREMGYSMSVNCPDICWLADQVYRGARIKLYRQKEPDVS